MKKLHLINAKALTDIQPKLHKKLFSTLEQETLEWAKKVKYEAFQATAELKQEFEKNPNSIDAKYFRYLRRLLELKLEHLESQIGKDPVQLNKELAEYLNIESLNIPEYLSCSSISMYEHCPRKYYYRYMLGIKTPPTPPLFFGSSIDSALNFHFGEKCKGVIPPRTAVYASFYEAFDKGKGDVKWDNKVDANTLYKSGPPVLDAYLNEFDKITNPTDIQTEALIKIDNGGFLKGYLDILEEDAIVDTKTAAKKWETGKYGKHLTELQPRAYSWFFLEEFDRMPKEFRYQIVTKDLDENGNPSPKTQLIKFEVKKFEIDSFKLRVQRIWDEIQANIPRGMEAFPAQADPSSRDLSQPGFGIGKEKLSPLCGFEWCEYASICQKSGLKIPLKWDKNLKKHIYEVENDSI